MIGHGDIRFVGPVCVRGCGRSARELGGHCTPCWMGLTARERALCAWDAGVVVDDALERLWALPAVEPRGRAA